MTEPSQYFKGRTVQEQMNEVIGYVDVRSAEVATNAIAADVAQVHQDMLDADADASAAAASAASAAGTLANAVKKTGEASQSIAGNIAVSGDLTGGTVTVPAPVNNTDAANKKYVDDADALKANKTYVDAQDALKINITDINSFAVGLTGNQAPIAGVKQYSGETVRTVSANYIRCYSVRESIFDENNDPSEPKTLWLETVGNSDISKFFCLWEFTQQPTGNLQSTIEINNPQTTNKARLRINVPKTGAATLEFFNGSTWTTIA